MTPIVNNNNQFTPEELFDLSVYSGIWWTTPNTTVANTAVEEQRRKKLGGLMKLK